jgi:hypothetical protein
LAPLRELTKPQGLVVISRGERAVCQHQIRSLLTTVHVASGFRHVVESEARSLISQDIYGRAHTSEDPTAVERCLKAALSGALSKRAGQGPVGLEVIGASSRLRSTSVLPASPAGAPKDAPGIPRLPARV